MSYKERVITTEGYSRLGTEADNGVNMARDLEEKKTIKGDEPNVLIPFHAVDRVIKTISTEDREDKNPYGCAPGESGGGDFSLANLTINLPDSEGINAEVIHIEDGAMLTPIEVNTGENSYQIVLYDGHGTVTSFEPAIPDSQCTVTGAGQKVLSPFNTVLAVLVTGDCTIDISGEL